MRAFALSVVLGLGAFGLTAATPTQAQASWLSEALDNASFSINIGGTPYVAPYGPAVAPVPAYVPVPVYSPAPVCAPTPIVTQRPVFVPTPVPVYRPVPTPVYRPVPAPVAPPRNAYYNPNPWSQQHNHHNGNNGWNNGRNDFDWRNHR